VLGFLTEAEHIPPEDRVAVFDNDGTLWCEKPTYPQLQFFVDELRAAVEARPELAAREEYGAILSGDSRAIGDVGFARVAVALVELFDGLAPSEFTKRVRSFFAHTHHPDRRVPYRSLIYTPMLELIGALTALDFRVFVVTAGGADFVRAVSEQLYGVPTERVIGSRVTYRAVRRGGALDLVRTSELDGDPNEGPAKLPEIQRQIGQRPVLAAGNSPGDAEMLEYVATGPGPTLAMLVDHDDETREYRYESVAGTFDAPEPISETARRLDWLIVSMREDWTRVFD
jgi:phosphoserine phosphatase